MNQHTPGPWTLKEYEQEPCELIGNGTIRIADIFCTDFPEGAADARLIAAAPDLLAACEAILRAPSPGSNGPGSITIELQTFNLDAVRSAVAKARGDDK